MRKGNKERKKSLILAGKIKTKKNERNENENYYCFGDRTRSGTFFVTVSVSRTDNFMNVFNSDTSPRVFSYR